MGKKKKKYYVVWKGSKTWNISNKEINEILEDVIGNENGYIRVSNNGVMEAFIQDGVYSVTDTGITKQVYKSKTALKSIFIKLIDKHLCFNDNGKIYSRRNGKWSYYDEGFRYV